MSDVELDNKIRLNQVRRDAIKERMEKADSHDSKKNLYGDKKEEGRAKKYSDNLKKISSPVSAAKAAKDLLTTPTEIKVMDVAIYGVALALAGFKDLLDLAIGIIPGVVTVIGFCISMAIGLILLFDGVSSSKRRVARNLTKKFLILIAGTMVESFLFGLNLFPFEMATVALIYWMTLRERKKEKRLIEETRNEEDED
ncbi:MAG: hypothetical protein V3574_02720 [Candidatus Moraniibacteriota bacterium]